MAVTVIKKCITITLVQQKKIKAIQMRRMAHSNKTVSFSSVMHDAIDEGLNHLK